MLGKGLIIYFIIIISPTVNLSIFIYRTFVNDFSLLIFLPPWQRRLCFGGVG